MKLVLSIAGFVAVIAVTVVFYIGYRKNTPDNFLKEGLIEFQQQNYDKAIENYEKAVAMGVKSPNAFNMLGLAYRFKNQQGKVCDPKLEESEIVYFEEAVDLDHNYVPALKNLAYTYYTRGYKAKAAVLFKKVLELNPPEPDRAQIEKLIAEGAPAPTPLVKKHRGR